MLRPRDPLDSKSEIDGAAFVFCSSSREEYHDDIRVVPIEVALERLQSFISDGEDKDKELS